MVESNSHSNSRHNECRYDHDLVVVGGGAFGTALASLLANLERPIVQWVRRAEQAAEINDKHTNSHYLEGVPLSPHLRASCDLAAIIPKAKGVLVVVPSGAFRTVASQLGDLMTGDQVLLHATKGLEKGTFQRMSEILTEETCVKKIGVISGPNLAREIVAGSPAGATIASRYDEVIDYAQKLFAGGVFRLYGGRDMIGTEIAGAFKNIIAIAAGISDGLGFGDNSKSLLITRGLHEMARFGISQGAILATFSGLSGMGDLVATCTSTLSRNHQVGRRLGAGEPLNDILASMRHVSEGVPTTAAVMAFAMTHDMELPIVAAVHRILFDGYDPKESLGILLSRPVGVEMSGLQ